MEIAGYTVLNWLLLFGFCIFCGAAIFYLVYGAVSMFRSDSGQNSAESWLLDRRTLIITILSIASLIVIASFALPA